MATLPSPARHVIAIASGKGGVGKSTVALNVALAMRENGRRVGLLDADIFGPDIPAMMNVTRRQTPRSLDLARAKGEERAIEPLERYGIATVSSALMVGEDHPLSLASVFIEMLLRRFVLDVQWGELDVLLVDLPPGTADLQQMVLREYPLSGVVVVVTPQEVAHLDAKKVVAMCRRAGTAILGGVENMSGMTCPHCSEQITVFPPAAEERTIWAAGVEKLGEVPMDAAVGASGAARPPVVMAEPDSRAAWAFRQIADRLSNGLPS